MVGANCPQVHWIRPFSWKKPSRELQPTEFSNRTSRLPLTHTRASVEPYCDFIDRLAHGRLPHKEQRSGGIVFDGYQTAVHFGHEVLDRTLVRHGPLFRALEVVLEECPEDS